MIFGQKIVLFRAPWQRTGERFFHMNLLAGGWLSASLVLRQKPVVNVLAEANNCR
jgi:hypothetical protein